MNTPEDSAKLYHDMNAASGKFVQGLMSAMNNPGAMGGAGAQPGPGPELVQALIQGLALDSERWMEIQRMYYQRHLELWANLARSGDEAKPQPIIEPEKNDRRFKSEEWQRLPFFDYIKQAYLLNSRWLAELVEAAKLDPPIRNKLRFYTRQLVDAAAPANFPATNPEVIKLASETKGESLIRGMELLSEDMKKGRISMTDDSAFEIGGNVAITPGAVVFENELLQLIQYSPSTEQVYSQPLLMVPPCINKYFILDLRPENSLVRYAVSQGHTVFMVSWRNATDEIKHATWENYVEKGVISAIEAARDICGVKRINVLGFCIGGTLVSCALAVMSSQKRNSAANLTLLASMLDFSDTGEISIFVDEEYVRKCERDFAEGGLLRGEQLARTFSSLRAIDLIWNYVVNNYLKGRRPDAFDLLYWNGDATNLPGPMYAYYMRNMYYENSLRKPRKLRMCDVPINLSRLKLPTYIMASREDHIVPWKTAFESTHILRGDIKFVLAASGHIAGVINSASQNLRNYNVNDALPETADEWLEGSTEVAGSWWNDWGKWLATRAGAKVKPRTKLGSKQYPVIEPAPGRYVKARRE